MEVLKSEIGGKQMRRNSLLIFLLSLILLLSIMADTVAGEGGGGEAAAVHIVYTEKPEGEEPEAFHIRTLTSVLGSEEAAKEAILYSYKTAASGFSAKLTPEQVSQISRTWRPSGGAEPDTPTAFRTQQAKLEGMGKLRYRKNYIISPSQLVPEYL